MENTLLIIIVLIISVLLAGCTVIKIGSRVIAPIISPITEREQSSVLAHEQTYINKVNNELDEEKRKKSELP